MQSDKLLRVIKRIIHEEVKRTLNEVVENHINKILAERFISSLNSNQKIFSESSKEEKENTREEVKQKRKEITKERKNELLRKLGVSGNPMAEMIFEDTNPIPSTSGGYTENSGFIDDEDDEGVDLSQFGLQ